MEHYIYFNGYQYKTCTHEESIQYISGLDIVLCSSFFWKENSQNLNDYRENSGTGIITPHVLNEISKKKDDPNYKPYFSSDKEIILQEFKKVSIGTDLNSIKDFIGDICDAEPSLIQSKKTIVLCAEPHEAANCVYRGKPYLYRIDPSDLQKYNGLKNYRKAHVKDINKLVTEIKNKI